MLSALVRRAILGLAGAVLLAIGLGFATYAAFLGLAYWQGKIAAALVLTAIFAGLGLIFLYLARLPKVDPRRPAVRVLDAFLDGFEAGKRMRRRPGRD